MKKFNSVDELIKTVRPVEPVYCIRPNSIKSACGWFKSNFPGQILYAVKTNPNEKVIKYFIQYFHDNNIFAINEPIDGNQATSANGSTIGFNVKDVDQGNAWHQAGVDNGGTSIEDPPGIREYDGNKMFLAYLRDPSGNKLCGLLRIE